MQLNDRDQYSVLFIIHLIQIKKKRITKRHLHMCFTKSNKIVEARFVIQVHVHVVKDV